MYKMIMVPTDCSGFDREAIRVGFRIAERSGAKVRLVRVITTGSFFGAGATPDGYRHTIEPVRHDQEVALSELYAIAAECRRASDVDVSTSLETGPVADALVRYAKRNDVDLIVISSHGRGGISRITLGSVTDSLIRGTTIPVLVVKPPASYLNPQVRGAFSLIVVPLDGSGLAEQILEPVLTLATFEDAEIVLLNVIKRESSTDPNSPEVKASWWEEDVAAGKAYLARVAEEIRRRHIRVTTDVIVGDDIPEEIAAYAARQNADLVAIATHGRGGLARVLRGSVADALTRAARMCILVFHPTGKPTTSTVADGALAHSA